MPARNQYYSGKLEVVRATSARSPIILSLSLVQRVPDRALLFVLARIAADAAEWIRAAEELIETWPEIH